MIRLYGHRKGEGSFVQVTRGMRIALLRAGALAGEVAVDMLDGERVQPGAEAEVALHCGAPLGVVLGHQMGMHKQHWLLLAPNSEGIPPFVRQRLMGKYLDAATMLERPLLDGFLAPSEWAASVLRREFPEHKVVVARHGVHPEVHTPSAEDQAARRNEYRDGAFRVMHFTSTLGQRKGTTQLMEAWRTFVRDCSRARPMLLIVAHPLAVNELLWKARSAKLDPRTFDVVPNPETPLSSLAAGLRYAHVVCQPSRGEGFGLVPLEARACGVPVIMTNCTGHSEHWDANGAIVTVEHGEAEPMDDYPAAIAPSVSAAAIGAALADAFLRWPALADLAAQQARGIAAAWSWDTVCADAIAQLNG